MKLITLDDLPHFTIQQILSKSDDVVVPNGAVL
jgi:hypothetical protein